LFRRGNGAAGSVRRGLRLGAPGRRGEARLKQTAGAEAFGRTAGQFGAARGASRGRAHGITSGSSYPFLQQPDRKVTEKSRLRLRAAREAAGGSWRLTPNSGTAPESRRQHSPLRSTSPPPRRAAARGSASAADAPPP